MKKKNFLILLTVGFLMIACQSEPKKFHMPVSYRMKPEILNIVDSFLTLYPSRFVELHINKVCRNIYYLGVLYGGESPMSSVPACAYAYSSNGTCIGIYSGIEELYASKDSMPPVNEELVKKGHFWFIRLDWEEKKLKTKEADSRLRSPFKPLPGYITPDDLNPKYVSDSLINYHYKNPPKRTIVY